MTGAEVAIIAAVVSAVSTTVSGIDQYNTAKSQVKATRSAEQNNAAKMARNIELTEKQRTSALQDKARQDRLETGSIEAKMGASGLDMNFGSPLELQLFNDIAQDTDTIRINSKFDDAIMSEHIAKNDAAFALQQQRDKFQSQKKGAIWSTIGSVGSTVAIGVSGD